MTSPILDISLMGYFMHEPDWEAYWFNNNSYRGKIKCQNQTYINYLSNQPCSKPFICHNMYLHVYLFGSNYQGLPDWWITIQISWNSLTCRSSYLSKNLNSGFSGLWKDLDWIKNLGKYNQLWIAFSPLFQKIQKWA